MLDTLTLVETPEGISLHLRSAGLMPRAAAWAIDFAIRLGIVWATGVAIALVIDPAKPGAAPKTATIRWKYSSSSVRRWMIPPGARARRTSSVNASFTSRFL